jgi:hypothetical protein
MAEGANSPKSKFFGAVARLESGLVEFSHPLDQCSQMWRHLRFAPLVLDIQGGTKVCSPTTAGRAYPPRTISYESPSGIS